MTGGYRHSVSLDVEKCKGCTACLKRCPTEAIRIRDGRAVINADLCIDCGECIRVCPYKAKRATFDLLDDIPKEKKLRIALPPPSFYGQFDKIDDVDYILDGLLRCGFDEVFEIARCGARLRLYAELSAQPGRPAARHQLGLPDHHPADPNAVPLPLPACHAHAAAD